MTTRKSPAGTLTGRHVLFGLLAFFGLILAVNGTFVVLALGSFAGVETDQAYLKGLAYNRVLESAEEQRARGWTVASELVQAEAGTGLRARYLDRDGHPLTGLTVALALRHPTQAALDSRLVMNELGDGWYDASLEGLALGQWRAILEAGRGGALEAADPLHRREERLWLK